MYTAIHDDDGEISQVLVSSYTSPATTIRKLRDDEAKDLWRYLKWVALDPLAGV